MSSKKNQDEMTDLGREILESMVEALDYEKGKTRARVTRFVRPAAPPSFDKQRVLELRKRLNSTQEQFAALLNVSRKTVESWEQGVREPSDMALRLLQILENPAALTELLHKMDSDKDTQPGKLRNRPLKSECRNTRSFR